MEATLEFNQARKDVKAILTAENPLAEASAYVGEVDDPNRLKVAQYALLVPIIRKGMQSYLDVAEQRDAQPTAVFASRPSVGPKQLADNIGGKVGDSVEACYRKSPFRPLICTLAYKRASLISYGDRIAPVESALHGGSRVAVTSMVGTSILSGLIINQAKPHTDEPREDFIDAVKRSHQLTLTRTIMHFVWNETLSSTIKDLNGSLINGLDDMNEGCVRYDEETGKAEIGTSFFRWGIPGTQAKEPGGEGGPARTLDSIPQDDARVGCPFSFSPEELKRFHVHIVNQMESNRSWPEELADKSPSRLLGKAVA